MRQYNRIIAALCHGALLWALLPASAVADTLIHNISGYTPTAHGIVRFSALRIADDGTVAKRYTMTPDETLEGLTRVDGRGATLLPGLIDAHGHVFSLGRLRTSVDLAGSPSLEDSLSQIRIFVDQSPGEGWVLGRGWNQVLWPSKRFPTAAQLSQAVQDRPVWLRRIDGHAGWANLRAMELAGISRDSRAPSGGAIERDADGNPTGIFVDAAMALIENVIPPYARAEDALSLKFAIEEMNRLGITSVHDAGVSARDIEIYKTFADRGELTVRVYAMLSGSGQELDTQGKPLIDYANGRLSVRSVKLYADGALGSRGAALLAPYSDDAGNSGLLFEKGANIEAMIRKANERGFQASVHAIGDAANKQVLDAFEKVQGGMPSPHRNRVEHAQVVRLEDIPRFARLGIIAAMQPTHATSDMNMAEDRLGKDRIRGAYAWQRFIKQGTPIAAGSDFPVELSNPFLGLHAAVTRQNAAGKPPGGWHPEQSFGLAQALRAFTLDAAYAAHQENRIGSLEAGKAGDFILVDQDIFEIDPAQLYKTQVLQTWLDGVPVYSRDH